MTERGSRLVLAGAAVTALVLLVQVALISAMSGAYLERGEALRAVEKEERTPTLSEGRGAVFEPITGLPVAIADKLRVHVASVQIGDSVQEDIKNSYMITMDAQTAIFASKVRQDPLLAKGFNAVGFSQGNLLIRAYIERYNDPPVVNFASFHGPLAGVGALPQCTPTDFICKEIDKLIGDAVYSKKVQDHLAQSNYFRDPLKIAQYLDVVHFLPDLNNEKTVNATYRENFLSLQSLVLVRANGDTQVFPKESEWFGAYEDGEPYERVLGFNETKWYREDSFGLQTLHRAGKVHFLATEGNHLQFSTAFLLEVVSKYFMPTLLA